jgi:PAS domain S-box-containing protein
MRMHDSIVTAMRNNSINAETSQQPGHFKTLDSLILIFDADENILSYSQAFRELVGTGIEQTFGHRVKEYYLPDIRAGFTKEYSRVQSLANSFPRYKHQRVSHDIQRHIIKWSSKPLFDMHGNVECFIATGIDVTAPSTLTNVNCTAERAAFFDSSTVLADQNIFLKRLSKDIKRCKNDGGRLAVLAIHTVASNPNGISLPDVILDKSIRIIGKRLMNHTPLSCMLATCHRENFLVLVPDLNNDYDTVHLAREFLECMSNPVAMIDYDNVIIRGNIGISLFPDDATDPEALIENSHLAVNNNICREATGYRFYNRNYNKVIAIPVNSVS